LGCRQLLPDYRDARKTVEEIHKLGGKAIVAHPWLKSNGKRFRFINEQEKMKIKELYDMADEVEGFNAQIINFIPVIAWVKEANYEAQKYAFLYGKMGISVSDAHFLYEQVKISGIYVPEENFEISALFHYLDNGDFCKYRQHVGWRSFLQSRI
jgi:hypothetical protein